ncbi:MAG: putative SOS response-associated peptidase YedK [Saprospiraceae bacterium]|jgi:putative SOS response-associated peptidase YedK
MCGRYVVVSKLKAIEKRFQLREISRDLFSEEPRANVSIGQYAPVISSEFPETLQLMQFGLTPFWAKKPTYFFNARSEGDSNKENDPNYKGTKGIITKPAFRHTIRRKRCLVIADAFIEGSKKDRLNKPYLIYRRDGLKPFALAGLWDSWTNKDTGEVISSFAIITTTANEILQKIGHHRSPVLLSQDNEAMWLDEETPLGEVTTILRPYPSNELNAYPISPAIKNPRAEGLDLLLPIGQRIYPEYDFEIHQELSIEGMGATTARKRRDAEDHEKPKPPTLFD